MSELKVLTDFDRIGGDAGVRRLVQRFYAYMDQLPEARGIRAMHPEDLEGSADKLYRFLCGWLGGPHLYEEKYGPPNLRMRHFPFVIGRAERNQWMHCMELALAEMPLDTDFRQHLHQAFGRVADHMINRDEPV